MNHSIKMSSHRPPLLRHQSGVSLIEVLVAILVIALGILTMLAMQINSTKLTKTSEMRAMGALLVSDLADRMRANRTGFTNNEYAVTESAAAPKAITTCTGSKANCTPAEMAQQDLAEWLTNIRFNLPSGTARVSPIDTDATLGKSGVDVWLIWIEPDEKDAAGTPSPATCPKDLNADFDKSLTAGARRCMYFRINV